jgi:RNA polymerase sigma factor (TIGR02999 family)
MPAGFAGHPGRAVSGRRSSSGTPGASHPGAPSIDGDAKPTRVTELLRAVRDGERGAFDELFPLVYESLRRSARRKLAGERSGHTLSSTDLVHEAYLKLVRLDRIEWQGRAHFLAVAAQVMRNVLVDYALRRKAHKRGGGQPAAGLEPDIALAEAPGQDLLALHRAMQRLEEIDARQSRVVECRLFSGMNIEETAVALGISPASVKRDWAVARAWLNRELGTRI